MRLIYKKYHHNGFKIYLASKLNGIKIDCCPAKNDIRNGAQLQFNFNGLQIEIDPNSAVLKLFGSKFSSDLKWIDWEISLQESLIPYLRSLTTGKEDKSVTDSITAKLQLLNASVPSPPQFFFGELDPTDVVLFGALIPLLFTPKAKTLLDCNPKLMQYLSFLRSQTTFNEAEMSYFGEKEAAGNVGGTNFLATSASSVQDSEFPEVEEPSVTESEISAAEALWLEGPSSKAKQRTRDPASPILPVKGEKNIMITSALPYVNNVPHLGNIIGCVLSADCFARFCRIRGDNIIYICGTDEYGTATETKALSEGLTPQEICDKYHAIHSDVYHWFNISFDFFGRTTTNSQTVAAQSIFWNLYKNDKITQNATEQLFCGKCERFLADRFVEGTCPFPGCKYEDARGDQCDGCGKLVNATDLINPRCKLCSETPFLKCSTHLYLDLSKIEDDLKQWVKAVSPQWTPNAKVICESWIRDGLKERCITRDLKWGTPVPLDGFTDKVFYVWFDAPIGYISITMEYTREWELWWKNQDNVSYYQFMAKDNVLFHSVIFPSCQIGTKDSWTKVTHLMATEYLNYEDGKFSKSRGVGVFGNDAKETGIASDVWRFYLLYLRPENQDTTFSWTDLQTKNNYELLNNLGNFINRSLKFVYQFYEGKVPQASPQYRDFKVMAFVNQEFVKYSKALDSCRLRDGIRCVLSITRIGNQYIQENEPYKLIKPDRPEEDKARGATVINIAVNIVALVAVLLQPFMPDTSKQVLDVLDNPKTLKHLPCGMSQFIKAGQQIREPSPLIRKINDEEIEKLKNKFAGSVQPENGIEAKKAAVIPPSANVAALVNPQDSERLEELVAEQGSKIRDLKSKGTSKDVLGPEIERLLQLKEALAKAQSSA